MHLLGQPEGLVLVASERLWPQIDALAQWGPAVSEIHLVPAYGDDEPGGPLERLEAFITDNFPQVLVRRHDPVLDNDPAEILAAVAEATATGEHWLVDASGGTRLMFAGLLEATRWFPRVKVVYRDDQGPWFEMQPGGGARELAGIDVDAIDRFTVEGLLALTWSDDRRIARVLHSPVEAAVEQAAARTWAGAEWRAEFERCVAEVRALPGRESEGQGGIFERFVLSLVRAMGVDADDVAISASLYDGATRVQEVDVVVNSHGRLHVIDCKLTEDEDAESDEGEEPASGKVRTVVPLSTQIREADATRRQLGDGGDQYILLRPNRVLNDEFRSLCAAYDLRVIDQAVLEGLPLPEALSRLLRPEGARHAAPPAVRMVRLPESAGVLDLHAEFTQNRDRVRVYDHLRFLVLTVSPGQRTSSQVVRSTVLGHLGDGAAVVEAASNAAKTVWTVVVRPGKGRHEDVRAMLATLTAGHFTPADG